MQCYINDFGYKHGVVVEGLKYAADFGSDTCYMCCWFHELSSSAMKNPFFAGIYDALMPFAPIESYLYEFQ